MVTVFSTRKHRRLNLRRTSLLSNLMAILWIAFRDGAEEWKRVSRIWADSTPVMIAISIGQDAEICNHSEYAEERTAWAKRFDYSKVLYVTMALASHLEYVSKLVTQLH